MRRIKQKFIFWFLRKISIWSLLVVISEKGFGYIKGDIWEWMESWLTAYDQAHNTNLKKEIMDWINKQPMGA